MILNLIYVNFACLTKIRNTAYMIIVTGGAGLIGSATIWALNKKGREDIIVVDDVTHDEKEHNLAPLKYEVLVGISEFREKLKNGEYNDQNIEGIIHLGACSATTEKNWDYLLDNNVQYTEEIIRWCVDRGARCVYASSAQTYGHGEHGYEDDHDLFDQLKPFSLYGKSKLDVDIWARDAGYLSEIVGIRYFNIFGPNEWHKEGMQSVMCKKFPELKADEPMTLFRSYNDEFQDGESKRDFMYVKDAVDVTLFFLENKDANGVFNVGNGTARSWNDVAKAMFSALGKEPKIEYIDMPEELRGNYQYFTQANIKKLRAAGYSGTFWSLEDSITDYVQNYLIPHHHLGEES